MLGYPIKPPSYDVHPIDDLKEHLLVDDKCWCKPKVHIENEIAVYTHNSMDGRELYETGEFLPN